MQRDEPESLGLLRIEASEFRGVELSANSDDAWEARRVRKLRRVGCKTRFRLQIQ